MLAVIVRKGYNGQEGRGWWSHEQVGRRKHTEGELANHATDVGTGLDEALKARRKLLTTV